MSKCVTGQYTQVLVNIYALLWNSSLICECHKTKQNKI